MPHPCPSRDCCDAVGLNLGQGWGTEALALSFVRLHERCDKRVTGNDLVRLRVDLAELEHAGGAAPTLHTRSPRSIVSTEEIETVISERKKVEPEAGLDSTVVTRLQERLASRSQKAITGSLSTAGRDYNSSVQRTYPDQPQIHHPFAGILGRCALYHQSRGCAALKTKRENAERLVQTSEPFTQRAKDTH